MLRGGYSPRGLQLNDGLKIRQTYGGEAGSIEGG